MISDAIFASLVLVVTLGIFGLMAWGLKRTGLVPGMPSIKNKQRDLELVDSKAIDSRNRLVVVSWKGKQFLLGANPNGIKLIASEDGASNSFKTMLDQSEQDEGLAKDLSSTSIKT